MVRLATGLETVEELNPVAGDHTYVLPETVLVPMVVDCPAQITLHVPAFATGKGFTAMVVIFLTAPHEVLAITV